jgi:hypothetical protein
MKRQDSSPADDFISSDPDYTRLHLADVLFDMKENSISEVLSANNQKWQDPAIKECLSGNEGKQTRQDSWPIRKLIPNTHLSITSLALIFSLSSLMTETFLGHIQKTNFVRNKCP